jgi:hypothetical protein
LNLFDIAPLLSATKKDSLSLRVLQEKDRGSRFCPRKYQEPLIPSPAITFSGDEKIDFVSEVYTHHSLFGEKINKERGKYLLSAEKNASGVIYRLKADRKACGWIKNTPLRLRLSVGNEFVRESKILLRFLAKWEEYPDMFFWLIP